MWVRLSLLVLLVCSFAPPGLAQDELAQAVGTWAYQMPMSTARAGVAAVVLNDQIYVIGGQDKRNKATGTVERYDPASGTWAQDLPPLQTARYNAAAVVYQGGIFVLGGRSEKDEVLDDVEFYDPATRAWRSMPSMDEAREGLAAVVLEGRLYVIGGSDEDGRALKSAELYDVQRQSWEEVSQGGLQYAAAAFATVVVGNTAYMIGGFNVYPLWFLQQFRPGTSPIAITLPELAARPRGSLAAVSLRDSIYIIGGRGPSRGGQGSVLSDVDLFVPQTREWRSLRPLNMARESFASVTLRDTIYVLGGRDERGRPMNSVERYVARTRVAAERPSLPEDFRLTSMAPNPFSTASRITFEVSARSTGPVQLLVYDVQGRLVRTLAAGALPAGRHEVVWDGTDQQGRSLSSGLYLCRLRQGPYHQTAKLILIR